MTRFSLKEISLAGMVAAVYTVLTLALAPFSFGVYQVRIAEALTVVPGVTRAAVPGLFVGCLLANALGGLGYQDIVFGSLITLAAALATRWMYRMSASRWSWLMAGLPVLFLWVGGPALLWGANLTIGSITALLAALVISAVAAGFQARRGTGPLALALVSGLVLALIVCAVLLGSHVTDTRVLAVGGAAIVAAAGLTWWVTRLRLRGGNPSALVAPLPPVLFNAFGVSLYLAPILGFNYWFAVQMIGVGQLIACYLFGLPLLRLLETRRALFDG